MTLDEYNLEIDKLMMAASGPNHPAPIEAVALVFEDGRACVLLRSHGQWREALSAPIGSEDGLACASDLRLDVGLACVSKAVAQ